MVMTLLLPHLLQQNCIDAGSGDDSITVTTSKLGKSDSISGGTGSDTLSVTGSGKVVDKDFANLSSIEILAISGVTKLTLGKKASRTGISDVQVTGDIGLVNLSKFTNAVSLLSTQATLM